MSLAAPSAVDSGMLHLVHAAQGQMQLSQDREKSHESGEAAAWCEL